MDAFAQWLAATPVSLGVRRALWLIPLLQAVHILAIAAVLSSAAMIDLRILGLAGRSQTLRATAQRFVPWIWTSLIVLAATGLVLVVGEPKRSLLNPAFQLKMLMLAVAVAGMLALQGWLRRNLARRDDNPHGSKMASAFVVLTFLLWCAIAFAGRWIAYIRVA
jgi:uncharacterized membrane protein